MVDVNHNSLDILGEEAHQMGEKAVVDLSRELKLVILSSKELSPAPVRTARRISGC